jgi:hypothetical protein
MTNNKLPRLAPSLSPTTTSRSSPTALIALSMNVGRSDAIALLGPKKWAGIAAIYGVHLMVIAVLNEFLRLLAIKGRDHYWKMSATAIFPVVVFLFGTAVAFVAPSVSLFIWFLTFGAPVAGWLAARCEGGTRSPSS